MLRGIIALSLAAAALCWLLLFQAGSELWYSHLVVDPVVYWHRAASFHDGGGSWAQMGMNEYQPGALWFFASVMAVAGGKCEFDTFFPVLLWTNIVLLVAHVLLARVFVSVRAAWLTLFFAVLVGPILLCRFELLVSLLVLGAWLLWRRAFFLSAGFLLGAATATKVYPLLLVPLLCIAAWRESGPVRGIGALAAWTAGGLAVTGALMATGGSIDGILASLQFHFDKPFGVEGLLGSGIPLLQGLLGIPLRLAPRNGIHGFESDLGALATLLLEWCWLPAVAAIVWIILRQPRAERCADPAAIFVLIGAYVLLGKLTAPQYAWWALPFLALASKRWMSQTRWIFLLSLLAFSLVLAQSVYPLNYSEFLECFRGDYLRNRIFWLNLAKNVFWLAALVIASRALLRRTSEVNSPAA